VFAAGTRLTKQGGLFFSPYRHFLDLWGKFLPCRGRKSSRSGERLFTENDVFFIFGMTGSRFHKNTACLSLFAA